jgi:hypothetical protein
MHMRSEKMHISINKKITSCLVKFKIIFKLFIVRIKLLYHIIFLKFLIREYFLKISSKFWLESDKCNLIKSDDRVQ